ncbi:hypothetical protein LCGC14_0891370 [marine sediment metagenome]|uniref:Yip1 domain-containing protein n=1 Tax=marine sediment metagenome TaxID=412755 RepID=A0A0F9S668_9ZZZZ|nr:MAG: hypothetical protein Lokiarch_31370 [Candidatus Lokiarchaeum sp. GC14_75]HDZ17767.1 hypothetical protein [archaeon]
MSNDLEKITKFMTIKRDVVEETISDEQSTKFAIFLIAVAMVLGTAQSLLQNFLTPDVLEWIVNFFGITTPSPLRIVLDAVFSNIIFPMLVIVLTFYIGNALKGEAESLNHVIRALGYSTPPLIISSAFSFLGFAGNIILSGLSALINVVFGFWFVIVVVFALMITFKKGALTGIGAVLISAIIAAIGTGWTIFII